MLTIYVINNNVLIITLNSSFIFESCLVTKCVSNKVVIQQKLQYLLIIVQESRIMILDSRIKDLRHFISIWAFHKIVFSSVFQRDWNAYLIFGLFFLLIRYDSCFFEVWYLKTKNSILKSSPVSLLHWNTNITII